MTRELPPPACRRRSTPPARSVRTRSPLTGVLITKVLLCLLLLSLAAPRAGALGEASLPECDDDSSFVLNLGLPQSEGIDREVLRARVRTALADLDGTATRCPGQPLQVNLVVGTHYQLLDWLGQGHLDAAVVPALSHHLLSLDNVAVQEIPLSATGREALTPAYLPRWRSWRFPATGSPRVSDTTPDEVEGFLAAIWRNLEGHPPPPTWPRDAGAAAILPPDACPAPPDGYRLALPSHLSTYGFLAPVDEAHGWLEARLAARGPDLEAAEPHARECFWRAFFDDVCFYFEPDRSETDARLCPLRDGEAGGVEIRVGRQEAQGADLTAEAAAPPAAGPTRHRLLMRRKVAQDLFGGDAAANRSAAAPGPVLPVAETSLLPVTSSVALYGSPGSGGEVAVPGPFRTLVRPEPFYGVRTFAFSVRETIDLLALHQRTSRSNDLALILPGGGVKAAYQSRLLDELYGSGQLANYRVAQDTGALPVQYVVGTSGGALLGLFVARQGGDEEWNLSQILWKEKVGDTWQPLSSDDIFPTTDLPRYLSLVLVLLIFCGVLAAATVPAGTPLAPESLAKLDVEPPPPLTAHSCFRPRLLLALALALFSAPLMARWLGGLEILEHTPEIEGLLYAVLVVVAMLADQCLVYQPEPEGAPTEGSEPSAVASGAASGDASADPSVDTAVGDGDSPSRALVSPLLLAVLGGLFVLAPSVVRLWPGDAGQWLAQPISFLLAYAVLGLTVLVILLGSRRTGGGTSPRAVAGWIAVAVVASAVAWIVELSWGADRLAAIEEWPLLLGALAAAVLLPALGRGAEWLRRRAWWGRLRRGRTWNALTRRRVSAPAWLAQRGPALLRLLQLLLGSLLLVELCRPGAHLIAVDSDPWLLLFAESKLRVGTGALLALLGLLLLTVAWTLWLWEHRPRYQLHRHRRFVEALLFVIGGVALVTYAILWLWSQVSESFTLFELTLSFWVGLALVSAVLAILVILWGILAAAARRSTAAGARFTGPLSEKLLAALAFLCSPHPNGHVIRRRFVRIVLLAVGGLLWWNLVLAPAVYGNRAAQDYLGEADTKFGGGLIEPLPDGSVKRFETRLLAPANALAEKGTHYVLVVPDGEECPSVRQPRGSSAAWHRFRAQPGQAADLTVTQADDGAEPCLDIDLTSPDQRKVLLSFVFASGSPFPVFPAHAVDLDPSPEGKVRKLLVDGGYSNNVPVEVAALVEASQMLVVHSSHPLDCDEPGEGGGLGLSGPLIRNSIYLPGFLYERSQQGDRLSRQGAFVTSLAPACRPDWPILTDFSEYRIKNLLAAADEDLSRRIGRVESWGPVRILGGVELGAGSGTVSEGV